MKILDATCGFKGIWFQKNHPFVTFLDVRNGKYYHISKSGKKKCTTIKPDVVSTWKDAPFPDDYFDMVVFDPPHIIQNVNCNMVVDYGNLNPNTWKKDLSDGIKKLFKLLKEEGVFILKWNECNKSIDEILNLFPYKPLFGTRTGLNNKNIWLVFIKYSVDMKLDNFQMGKGG